MLPLKMHHVLWLQHQGLGFVQCYLFKGISHDSTIMVNDHRKSVMLGRIPTMEQANLCKSKLILQVLIQDGDVITKATVDHIWQSIYALDLRAPGMCCENFP